MAGYTTYNATDQEMWVTIYNEPGGFQVDYGAVGAGTWRVWESGPYAYGSIYKVRAEWPTNAPTRDTSTTQTLDGPCGDKPLVLFGGSDGVWWDAPAWRTSNNLVCDAWITIYNYPPGGGSLDSGSVTTMQSRDWRAGQYCPGAFYSLRAEGTYNKKAFDVWAYPNFGTNPIAQAVLTLVGDVPGWSIPGLELHAAPGGELPSSIRGVPQPG